MRDLRGSIIRILLSGILLGILFNFNKVKAEFLTYRGEITLKVLQDFRVNAEISLDIENTSAVAVNADWLAIKLLDKHIKNVSVVVSQNTPVRFYVLNDKEGAWLRVQEREDKHFVLNPGDHLKIYATGEVEAPFVFARGGMYLLNYPAEQPNIKLKVMVDKDIPLGSEYKFTLYKQKWRLFDFSNLPSSQLILFGREKYPIVFLYELISKYSYIFPASSVPCTRVYLMFPQVSYLFVDNNGIFLPYLGEDAYTSYLLRVVDLNCIKKIRDSVFYLGFKWNTVGQLASPVIFKWSNGKVYQLVNSQFVVDKTDKYGLLYFPIRSCRKLEDCLVVANLDLGKFILIDSTLAKDYKIQLKNKCDLYNTSELGIENLDYSEGILLNIGNNCGRVSRLLCGSVNMLANKQLILMPRGNFNTRCFEDIIGISNGILKTRTVTKLLGDFIRFFWILSILYFLFSLYSLLTCYNKR